MDYYHFALQEFENAAHEAGVLTELSEVITGRVLHLPEEEGYHNRAHCMRVATYAYRVGQMQGLSGEDCRRLLVAGVFHDAGHSRNAGVSDVDNVTNACILFQDWVAEHEGWVDQQAVMKTIWATCTGPAKRDRVFQNPSYYGAIADADMLVMADTTYQDELEAGLISEGYAYDPVFVQKVGVFTSSARELFTAAGKDVPLLQV